MQRDFIKTMQRNWLWIIVNLAAIVAAMWLAMLVWDTPNSSRITIFSSDLARSVVTFSGKVALILLTLSLACTPAASIFGFRKAVTVRKSLGLWTVGFALFHALFLIGNKAIFYDVNAWQNIWSTVQHAFVFNTWGKMPYARAGVFAFTLLIPLALTSNRLAMRLLKKNWKRLHRLVYLVAALAIWHYLWRTYHLSKWGIPTSSEVSVNWWQPLLFTTIVAMLLLVRIPKIRSVIKKRRNQKI